MCFILMRLKKERPKRKKLGNLTVITDKVNIVTPGGKPLQVSGTGLGGVRAPKRQYQFSFDQAPGSVTGKEDVLQPPPIPLPQQPQQPPSAVTNSLGRIGRMLGDMALAYAGQALFNQAGRATENWMYNSESNANVPEVSDLPIPVADVEAGTISPTIGQTLNQNAPAWGAATPGTISPTIGQTLNQNVPAWIEPTTGQVLNQGGNAAWAVTRPPGIGGTPTDITYSNSTTWTGNFPSSSPRTPVPPVFSPNLPSPIRTSGLNPVVGPDSAGLTPQGVTTPYSAGLTPASGGPSTSTPSSGPLTPPYSGPNLAQRIPGAWPGSPEVQTPAGPVRPMMTEVNLATPFGALEGAQPLQAPQPAVYRPVR